METLGRKPPNDWNRPKPIGEAFRPEGDIRTQAEGWSRFSPGRFTTDFGHTPLPTGSHAAHRYSQAVC
jgi:hypothetical protein